MIDIDKATRLKPVQRPFDSPRTGLLHKLHELIGVHADIAKLREPAENGELIWRKVGNGRRRYASDNAFFKKDILSVTPATPTITLRQESASVLMRNANVRNFVILMYSNT